MHEYFKCMTYFLLTLQQLSTYGIMHEHMNTWSWHWNKENTKQTLILTCDSKQVIKHLKRRHWKHKSMGKEAKQTNMWKQGQNKQTETKN